MDDDDESVFLAQENEVKNTTISEGVRSQIVKELMHEKFNFYMLVSEDENVSEKLISMLIPECN